MDAHLIRGTRQCLLDDYQIQQTVVTTSGNLSEASGEDIDERSGVAIETVETKQHRSNGKRKLCGIAGAHLDSSQEFSSVIPIAWPSKSAQKLMGMCLEDDGARAHDLSTLASQVARRADLIETTVGSRQRRKTGQPVGGRLAWSRPHRRRAR